MPSTNRKARQRIRREWKIWYKAVRKMRITLANVRANPAPLGERWRVGMVKYYSKTVRELEASEPPKYED